MIFNSYRTLALLLAAMSVSVVSAQSSAYLSFRDSIRNEFNMFHDRVVEHYSDFLRGEWHEFEPLLPRTRYSQPKPKEAPRADNYRPNEEKRPENPSRPELKPDRMLSPAPMDGEGFMFYTLPVRMEKTPVSTFSSIESTEEIARQLDSFVEQKVAQRALPALKKVAEEAGLNDYLIYRLVNDWAMFVAPEADMLARHTLIQYMLTNWGYDARIGYADNGAPLLFLPLNQTVYNKYILPLDGKKYYVFLPDGVSESALTGMRIHTYHVDPAFKSNRSFDMIIGKLNFPMKPHEFDLSYGNLHLKGTVNENLMPVLYRYPNMDMANYVISNPQPEVREDLVCQVREQLSSLENDEDVEALLQFMQHAFIYDIDEDNHGFEKPYFLEENLFFEKNDCEDRAMMYSYLLWHALGRENMIVHFPMHEATLVKLKGKRSGTSYQIDGSEYYISDPTYIGASTGSPMQSYKGISPQVDFSFKK